LRTFCETPDGQLQVGAARARDGKLAAYSRNSDHPLARRTQRHSCSHASDGHAGQWPPSNFTELSARRRGGRSPLPCPDSRNTSRRPTENCRASACSPDPAEHRLHCSMPSSVTADSSRRPRSSSGTLAPRSITGFQTSMSAKRNGHAARGFRLATLVSAANGWSRLRCQTGRYADAACATRSPWNGPRSRGAPRSPM
jgi:hypothetical protein